MTTHKQKGCANLKVKKTCSACPEQYDVYLKKKRVAYIRLRWGYLTVSCPWVDGVRVYDHCFKDEWKGSFDDEKERKRYFKIIFKKISEYLNEK